MQRVSELHTEILQATRAIENSQDNREINRIVEEIIIKVTHAEYASIWIYEDQCLYREKSPENIVKISMREKRGLLYQCFAKKEEGIYNYLTSEKGYVAEVDNPDNIRIKSKIMIPLMDNEKFLGIVTAYATIKKIKKFTSEDLELFKAITPLVKKSIQIRKLNSSGGIYKEKLQESEVLSKLKEIEESHEEQQPSEEVLQYVSNIVHDIRTPANGLLGFLEILQEQIKDARLQEYVGHARESALLISNLTSSILDGVSTKREKEVHEPTVVNTSKYFGDIADIFSANMAKKEISYNIFIDPLLPKEIELNSMKIKRVIMNLIGNANKFTPEHGCIEFSVRYKEKEKKLHVYVKDNGIGIAPEKQEDIFKAFKQAEENTKDIYGGTGLGLSICAAYVKEMGGKLLIDSAVDEGSTFYFDLPMEIKDYAKKFTPIKDSAARITLLMHKNNLCTSNHIARYLVKMGVNVDSIKAVTSLEQVPANTSHLIVFENKLQGETFVYAKKNSIKLLVIEENFLSLDKENLDGAELISKYSDMGVTLYTYLNTKKIPKVLIVEDDKVTIHLLNTILKDEYCHIDVAGDGQEGLELLKQAWNRGVPYDIIYSDQNMPNLSGEEMLKEYYMLGKDVKKRSVAVSISGDVMKKANQHLFDVFAYKPFKKEEIISAFLNAIK